MRRSPRCQGGKNSSLVSSGLASKILGFGGKLSGLGPLGAELLKTEPLCVIQFTDLG